MKKAITEEQLYLGLVLHDQCLFAEHFFNNDLSLGLSKAQKEMFCDQSERMLLCCGRKVAKTVFIESEIVRTGLTGSGEGMFVTPAQSHMTPVRSRITSKINQNKFFSLMHDAFNRAEGIDIWRKGRWTWHWRLEGMSGTDVNMVGLRAKKIMGDELAFGNMICHNSRELVALPGCKWIYAGVPNDWHHGILYTLDKTRLGERWSKHRLNTYDNPLFYGREKELIENYRGETTREYITQVMGQWGDELVRSFPPGAIAIDNNLIISMPSMNQAYISRCIERPSEAQNLKAVLKIPRVQATRFAIGVDYGYSPDPGIIQVYYEGQDDNWYELLDIELLGVIAPHQAKIIHTICDALSYQVAGIAIEYVGGGLMVAQELQRTDLMDSYSNHFDYSQVLVNSNPGGTIEIPEKAVELDEMAKATREALNIPDFHEYAEDKVPGMIKVRRKAWMNELLRQAMIRANNNMPGLKLWYGPDDKLIESTMNVAEEKTPAGYTVFKKLDKGIADHHVDAARNAVVAIDFAMSKQGVETKDFASNMGWSGQNPEWKAPWK